MRVLATVFLAALPGVALAEAALAEVGAVDWIIDQTAADLVVQDVGEWQHSGTKLIGVDSLTYRAANSWLYFDIPALAARFLVLNDRAEDRVSKAVLVFDNAPPVCGKDLATMWVDTGTGAFVTPAAAKAIDRLGTDLDQQNSDLYSGFMEPQIKGAHRFAQLLTLPDGSQFPAFSTGWGDGGYPVAALIDASGAVVAIYADFMGQNADGDWLLPPPCPGQS